MLKTVRAGSSLFLTSLSLSWYTLMNKTGVQLEPLTDVDVHLVIEKELGAN